MKSVTEHDWWSRVAGAAQRIQSNLDEPLSFRDLAKDAGFSPYHFHRVFQGMLGESPRELTIRLRLERAAHQLRTTDASVTEIAFDAGFETHEAFSRAFKVRFMLTPTQIRSYRESYGLSAPNGIHWSPEGSTSEPKRVRLMTQELKIEIVERPAVKCAAVLHRGPFQQIGKAFEELMESVGRAGLMPPAGPVMGVYLSDPNTTPEAELESFACCPVGERDVPSPLVAYEIPGGKFAKVVHQGHYSGLEETWQKLYGELLPAAGHELADAPPFEEYLNDCMDTPEKLLTAIYAPIQ